MIQWRSRMERWQRIGLTLFLGMIMAGITVFMLWSNAFAGNISGGAGGCGDFASAVQVAQDYDTIIQMVGQKPTDGAIITENLRISGGWSPNPTCTVGNQYFTTTTDVSNFGFSYLAPEQRAELENSGSSVLRIHDLNNPGTADLKDLIIENTIIFQSGFPAIDGGGISGQISSSARFLLDNVLFNFNEIDNAHNGAGMYFQLYDDSHMLIQDSEFRNNDADGNGGGLFIELYSGSYLTIENSLFADNVAVGGGAFEIQVNEGSHLAIMNSTFENNRTTYFDGDGGAGRIIINGGTAHIMGSTFDANDAGSQGGALYIQMNGGDVLIQDSSFTGNYGDDGGAALYVESTGSTSANVRIIHSTFADNATPNQFISNGYLNTSILDNAVYLPLIRNNVATDYQFARITGISITADLDYIVDFEAYNFVPNTSDVHVHFFFDTVAPEDAGVPGSGPWKLYGGPSPFTGYSFADRPYGPDGAEKLCILVANPNHSVRPGTGNCVKLP